MNALLSNDNHRSVWPEDGGFVHFGRQFAPKVAFVRRRGYAICVSWEDHFFAAEFSKSAAVKLQKRAKLLENAGEVAERLKAAVC